MDRDILTVSLRMSFHEADALSSDLSDLLCWCAGFNAALSPSEDHDRRPYGVDAVRKLSIKIKSAMDYAEKEENAR